MSQISSHLYAGFCPVGKLPSIGMQREIQRNWVESALDVKSCRALSIGCGFGDELDEVFEPRFAKDRCDRFVAVDISPLTSSCLESRLARVLGNRFRGYE